MIKTFVLLFLSCCLWLCLSRRPAIERGAWMSLQRIPDAEGNDYLVRRFLLPRNRFLNVYLHTFLRSDDDRALHDHPWHSVSFLVRGQLIEHLQDGSFRRIRLFVPVFRSADHAHRLEVPAGQDQRPPITVFVTGPRLRTWGFHCPGGWVRHDLFDGPRGCD